ncbi:hypothetical protein F5Y19DRAFT_18636 [Xylariaceae sp. FL1651]|nr:hypothetical protein F5Y19DRAFT_18636 [Xylariaceae sp. FL1651]
MATLITNRLGFQRLASLSMPPHAKYVHCRVDSMLSCCSLALIFHLAFFAIGLFIPFILFFLFFDSLYLQGCAILISVFVCILLSLFLVATFRLLVGWGQGASLLAGSLIPLAILSELLRVFTLRFIEKVIHHGPPSAGPREMIFHDRYRLVCLGITHHFNILELVIPPSNEPSGNIENSAKLQEHRASQTRIYLVSKMA